MQIKLIQLKFRINAAKYKGFLSKTKWALDQLLLGTVNSHVCIVTSLESLHKQVNKLLQSENFADDFVPLEQKYILVQWEIKTSLLSICCCWVWHRKLWGLIATLMLQYNVSIWDALGDKWDSCSQREQLPLKYLLVGDFWQIGRHKIRGSSFISSRLSPSHIVNLWLAGCHWSVPWLR